jgi:hypothetical protein
VQLEGTERRHPARLVLGARRVVDLEVEDIVVDDGEKRSVAYRPTAPNIRRTRMPGTIGRS